MNRCNNRSAYEGLPEIEGFDDASSVSESLDFVDFDDSSEAGATSSQPSTIPLTRASSLQLPSMEGNTSQGDTADKPETTGSFAYPNLSVIGVDEGQTVRPATEYDLSRNSSKYQSKTRRRGKRMRALLGVLVILLLAYGCFQVVKSMFKEDINQRISGTDATTMTNTKEALTPMVPTDPFYMMLIGSDSRNDDENERSDTNIVARVDPQVGTVNLISIPRDTAINLEGYGTQKFNAAYAYYGAEGAIKAAEGLLGVKISHYAEIDFGGLVELVNAVGGIDVDVPMRIEDANAGDKIIEAGMQHLDGEKALIFARSRSYTNGDFQRTANQRILVEALLSKIMTMNQIQLAPVVDAAANYLTTDMTVNQIQDYAILMQNFETINIYSVMVPSDTTMANEVSYVVCNTELLRQVMEVVSQGGDPSHLVNDNSVFSSAEADEMGATSTPIYVPD